jgi:hypothetical protein
MNSSEKFRIYSEIIRNNPVNAESKTGSSTIYGVVTQHEKESCRRDTVHVFRYIHFQSHPHVSGGKHRSATTLQVRYASTTYINSISRAYDLKMFLLY